MLFDTLKFHGAAFTPPFWARVFDSVLLPIFDHVRAEVRPPCHQHAYMLQLSTLLGISFCLGKQCKRIAQVMLSAWEMNLVYVCR